MNSAVIVCLAFFCGVIVSGQSTPCSNIATKNNLDSSRLNGLWYIVQGFAQGTPVPEYKCMKENVQADVNGRLTINLEYITTANNERVSRSSIGTPIEGRRSKLSYVSSAHPERTQELLVLDTDYDHYVIWMKCANENAYVAVSSKQTSLTPETLEIVKQKLRDRNVSGELHQIVQEDC